MATWWFCTGIRKMDLGTAGVLLEFPCHSVHDFGLLSSSEEVVSLILELRKVRCGHDVT